MTAAGINHVGYIQIIILSVIIIHFTTISQLSLLNRKTNEQPLYTVAVTSFSAK